MKEEKFELLQPWSTFVMKTQLPPSVLEKMIKITDEIIENRRGGAKDLGAGPQIEDQFYIESKILEQEGLMGGLLEMCRTYVVQAFCQNQPDEREEIVKEEWLIQPTRLWINSQKDNEYFPVHKHTNCAISSVMYLKIPEYLPSRRTYWEDPNYHDDGAITFTNNASISKFWTSPVLQIQPHPGDFFIFPAEQLHQVYPFRTLDGKGERRSVSFNAEFTSKSEQDALKIKQETI